MRHHPTIRQAASVVTAILAAACANQKPSPKTISSAGSTGYALAFPEALSQQVTQYGNETVLAKTSMTAMKSYPDALKDTDWQVVSLIYVQADQKGRSRAYADEAAQQQHVASFFSEERDPLVRRINGAVANTVDKAGCGCDVETHGAVAYGLKEAVERQLEARLSAVGDVEKLIEKYEKSLGKKNRDALSSQAADIAATAHIVHVSLPTRLQEIERRVDEAKQVKRTIQGEINNKSAVLNDPAAGKNDKKDATELLTELNGALTTIEIFEQEAEKILARGQEEIPALRKAYEAAFESLTDQAAENAKAATQP